MFRKLSNLAHGLDRLGDDLLPLMARFTFAAVLFVYFWKSGLTKLGDGGLGFINLSSGAYVQIFPRAMEAVGYDASALSAIQRLIVLGGTWAEFILPVLIVIGLLTRLSALGMIVFVILQSLTDLFGHGAISDPGTLGDWFDAASGSLILDQRSFWCLTLAILVLKGGGWLSVDRLVFGRL